MKKILLLSALIFFILRTQALIRNVPSQYSTIQQAMFACNGYDTVLVDSGTYFENIAWAAAPGIKLLSVAGSAATIIDGSYIAKGIKISTTASDTDIVIKGFTITHCSNRVTSGTAGGAGISINFGSVLLQDLIVSYNHIGTPDWADGAGILCENANVTMEDVTVIGNVIDSGSWCYGAGAQFHDGNIIITNCTFSNNESHSDSWCYGTGIYFSHCEVELGETKIQYNRSFDGASWFYGSGLYAEETSGTLRNLLITNNSAASTGNFHYGAGIYVRSSATSPPVIHATNLTIVNNSSGSTNANSVYNNGDSLIIANSIIWSNAAGTEVSSANANLTSITYSDVEGGYSGTGNINSDPLFVTVGDFHLLLSSPCIAAATLNTVPAIDLESNHRPMPSWANPDIGCYEMDEGGNAADDVINSELSFITYPNPASNKLTISIKQSLIQTVELFDLIGKKVIFFQPVIRNQQPDFMLDVSGLSEGIYLVKISSGEKMAFQKVIIER